MITALTLARREIYSHVVTPTFSLLFASFVLLSGIFFFSLIQQFSLVIHRSASLQSISPSLNEFVIAPFYQSLVFLMIGIVPLLCMGSIPRERLLGTYEFLMTAPISAGELVLGKFIGLFTVLIMLLSGAFLFPLSLVYLSDPEVPPLLVGFLGVIVGGGAFLSVGLGIAAFARTQLVAALVTFGVFLSLLLIGQPAPKTGGLLAQLLLYFSPAEHLLGFFQGVVDSGDIIYCLSLIFVGMFIAYRGVVVGR